MKNFGEYFESYLESNHTPIYHLTNDYYLLDILKSNKISRGWVDHPFFGKKLKVVSLTGNSKFRLSFKEDSDIIIELDKNKMIIDGYNFIPYDFFINSGKETRSKSDLRRKEPFEFEECLTIDINNIKKYIISINFTSDSFYSRNNLESIKILKVEKIKVLKNGTEI
jgi:hypothetical protein